MLSIMAAPLITKICTDVVFKDKIRTAAANSIRYGHVLRGIPPGFAKNLEQKLEGFLSYYIISL